MDYTFIFNLEDAIVEKEDPGAVYAIKYYQTNSGKMISIGDGYRHEMVIKEKHWNRILRIIKNKELDESGIESILRGLMNNELPEKYEDNFISAIKSGVIKDI